MVLAGLYLECSPAAALMPHALPSPSSAAEQRVCIIGYTLNLEPSAEGIEGTPIWDALMHMHWWASERWNMLYSL